MARAWAGTAKPRVSVSGRQTGTDIPHMRREADIHALPTPRNHDRPDLASRLDEPQPMTRRSLISATLLITLAASSTALAQPSLTPPTEPMAPAQPMLAPPVQPLVHVQDYRWQLVVADLATFGLGFATQSSAIPLLGYFGASPMVHAMHGNHGRALGSLGLRIGLPTAGVLVGMAVAAPRCARESQEPQVDHEFWPDFCGGEEMAVGLLGGIGAAYLIDWMFLGRVQKSVAQPAVIHTRAFAANPILHIDPQGGVSLGLGGTF